MLKNLEDTLQKRCLIGLTYFDADGNELKKQLLAGTVIAVDAEMGITLKLLSANEQTTNNPSQTKAANFIIPATLSCWFSAPKGEFHTSHEQVKMKDPDFLVTWDIYQTKSHGQQGDKSQEGVQQWWQWYPRTQDPQVN
ncbi:hypothetical protein AADZ84_16220 [Colwelliaceae bacterium MEBiC 14330]